MYEKDTYYFTFGVDHPLKNKVQPIRGTYSAARDEMFDIYGHDWCMQYNEAEFKAMLQRVKDKGIAYNPDMLPMLEAI